MRIHSLSYADRLRALTQRLRTEMSPAEALLWRELKGRRLLGYRFERGRALDRYTVDFYCPELDLAIDVIGTGAPWHGHCDETERTIRLRLHGVAFLAFTEAEVLHNLDGVVSSIRQAIRYLPVK